MAIGKYSPGWLNNDDLAYVNVIKEFYNKILASVATKKLRFKEETLDVTPTSGTLEFNDDRLYITNVASRKVLDRSNDVITATTTVSNTVTETTVYTANLGANSLKAGNVIRVEANGVISNATAADDITINVYMGSTLLGTFNPAIGNVVNEYWDNVLEFTVRSVGATGSVVFHGHQDIAGSLQHYTSIGVVDTTAAQDVTIKVIWDNAKIGNTISIYQGYTTFKN